jgi:hypothetical protein
MTEGRDEGRRADDGFDDDEDERRRKGSLLGQLLRKAVNQGVEAISDEKLRETLVAEIFRKAINKGGSVYDSTEDSLRRLVAELPLPKEVVDRIMARLDDYKADMLGMVKDEVHEFLDRVDVGYELQRVLTSLSFEISTEIRFVPNEKGVQPDVKASARVKRNEQRARRRRKPDPTDDEA